VFLFLDTENSGLSRDFSQIYEIALISTDSDLNLMSKFHGKCRNLPWVVPSPGALLITGITPDQLKNEDYSHYEMMCKVSEYIHAQSWPVIFAAYNMPYDQGIISQNLHSNLLDPFIMSARRNWNAPANCVFDVLNLVKAVSIYAPGLLKLDIKTGHGNPSMSLGNVCRQNGIPLSEQDAHGAYSDTKATIQLAKKLKTEAPEIWDQMLKMANRDHVKSFMQDNEVFAYSQCPYGTSHDIIGTFVTTADNSSTEAVVWDLSFDPADYKDKSDEELVETFKLWGDKRFETPMQTLLTHKQPVLMPADKADTIWPQKLSRKKASERAQWIKNNPEFAARLAKAAAKARPEFTNGSEPEEQIYSFPDSKVRDELESWKKSFHNSDWSQRLDLVKAFKQRFSDDMKKDPALKRFMIFAQRIIFANQPDVLGEKHIQKVDEAMQRRRNLPADKAAFMTVERAREELAEIEQSRKDGEDKWAHVTDTQIRSLKLYYTSLEKDFEALKKKAADIKGNSGPKPK
tara:strand:+ start:409 stop:1956 length:1548 start_codon:yes stop_codon:yes gene_type:complete